MPIVVSVPTLQENYLGLINNVLQEVGETTVTASDLTSPTDIVAQVMWQLNVTQQDMWQRGRSRLPGAQETGYFVAVADQETYGLADDFDAFAGNMFYEGMIMTPVDKQDIDAMDPGRTWSGSPRRWALWGDYVYFDYVPDTSFCAGKTVTNGGVDYVCIKSHTSASATEPGTGGSWATYWDTTLETGVAAWATGTAYDDGRIRYSYYRQPTPMVASGDYPDLPDHAIECLKVGARYRVKQYREAPDFKIDYQRYMQLLRQLGSRRGRRTGGTQWSVGVKGNR